MTNEEWLEQVAYKAKQMIDDTECDVYLSKFDDSYITHVGMENDISYLAQREIIEELTHGVGFSPKDGKWYGWSHRAIYGFEIGSTCKEGDCHYQPRNKDDFLTETVNFWDCEYYDNIYGKHTEKELIEYEYTEDEDNGKLSVAKEIHTGKFNKGVEVTWAYNNTVPNVSLRGTQGSNFSPYPDTWGRGEWVAKTMEDAKKMAQEFNEGVS